MEIQWNQKFTMHEIEKMIIRQEGRAHQQVHMDIVKMVNDDKKHPSKKSFVQSYFIKKNSTRRG